MTKDGAAAKAKPSPPRQVLLLVGALLLAGVAAVAAGATLFGLKDWLFESAQKTNKKSKSPVSLAELHSQVNKTPMSQLVVCLVLLVALLLVAAAAYRGRYFARWVVIGVWILGSLTPTPVGFTSVLAIGSSAPVSYKATAFLAGIAMIAAVVLVNLRPSVEYFNANRPPRPAGAPQRRGLFAPRPPMPPRDSSSSNGATRTATTRPANAPANDRSKSKQRASADAVAKGAEAARARAKAASKSRRTGS